MRTPWRGLTPRGRVLAVIGGALAAIGVFAGQADVVYLAILFLALPLLGWLAVLVTRPRLEVERATGISEVPLGSHFAHRLGITRRGGPILADVLAAEDVGVSFGAVMRLWVTGASVRGQRQVRADLVAGRRGWHRLGPLLVRITDPFGLAIRHTTVPGSTEVLVPPRVEPLRDVSRAVAAGLSGLAARMGTAGSDDVMVREYQTGDDVRRIHWRSSARHQQLMVRRVEQAHDLSVTLLVDTRPVGLSADEASDAVEWRISAGASIALHCVEEGFSLREFTPDGPLADGLAQPTPSRILTAYAELPTSDETEVVPPTLTPDTRRSTGIVVAVLGDLRPAEAIALADLAGTGTGIVLLRLPSPVPGTSAEDAAAGLRAGETSQAAGLLRTAGWSVTVVGHDTSVADAWAHALAGGDP